MMTKLNLAFLLLPAACRVLCTDAAATVSLTVLHLEVAGRHVRQGKGARAVSPEQLFMLRAALLLLLLLLQLQ